MAKRYVNIGPADAMYSDGTKPSPEPMFTNHEREWAHIPHNMAIAIVIYSSLCVLCSKICLVDL